MTRARRRPRRGLCGVGSGSVGVAVRSASAGRELEGSMTTDAWRPAIQRMLARLADTPAHLESGIPHWADADTGHWTTTPDGDWTGGYFIGMLWLAAETTGEVRYRAWALPLAERLNARITAETVFKSFPAYYGAAIGVILANAVRPREIALATARHMARHLYVPPLTLVQ